MSFKNEKLHVFSVEEFGAARENVAVVHVEFIGKDSYPADPYRREDGKERVVLVLCEALGVYRGCRNEKIVIDPCFASQIEIPLSDVRGWQVLLPKTIQEILMQVALLTPLIEFAAGSSASVEEKVTCLVGLREAVEKNKFLLPFLKQVRQNTTPNGE